jgi:hypothetical protein
LERQGPGSTTQGFGPLRRDREANIVESLQNF